VVGGIAVTLYVNNRVTYQSEKKDLKLYLNTIKLELEENILEINYAMDEIQHTIKYTNYLRAHHQDSLSRDSLRHYGPMSHTVNDVCYLKTYAFEMFKSSGIMRLMANKTLLTDIWELYVAIDRLKGDVNRYAEAKQNEMEKDHTLESERKLPYNARMYYFHVYGKPILLMEKYERRLRDLQEMVLEIEKELSPQH